MPAQVQVPTHPPGIPLPLLPPISVDGDPSTLMRPRSSSPFPSPTRSLGEQEFSPVPSLVSSVALGHESIGMDSEGSDDEDVHLPRYLHTHSVRGTQDLLAQITDSDWQLLATRASTSASEQMEKEGSLFRRNLTRMWPLCDPDGLAPQGDGPKGTSHFATVSQPSPALVKVPMSTYFKQRMEELSPSYEAWPPPPLNHPKKL